MMSFPQACKQVQTLKARLQKLPRKVRLAAAAVAMLVVAGVVLSSTLSKPAKLNIFCQHSFPSAEISVSIDGDLIYRGEVSGSRKRFGLFGGSKARGLAKSVAVTSGRHTVQVRLNAKADGYDQTRTSSVFFSPNQENSLSISQNSHGLFLSSQGGSEAPSEGRSLGSYPKYLASIVLSILGSGMSAVIGFLVQDFMRSQKGRLAAVTQIEPRG